MIDNRGSEDTTWEDLKCQDRKSGFFNEVKVFK